MNREPLRFTLLAHSFPTTALFRYWGWPKRWRAEIDKQYRRPGGVCNMTFYGPDGEVSPQNGIYLAYDEGRRFVTTDAFTEDFQPAGPFMIEIGRAHV